jgi:hypothetical protein
MLSTAAFRAFAWVVFFCRAVFFVVVRVCALSRPPTRRSASKQATMTVDSQVSFHSEA